MAQCVVLLSSGLDSTVNFLMALQHHNVLAAITFDYGQKAAQQEIIKSQQLCQKYSVRHFVIPLLFFKDFTRTSLISQTMSVPDKSQIELQSDESNASSAAKVWVPNRNGIFLNIAAGYAEGLGAQYVIPGFNLEEASTFPDNSQEYQNALKHSFSFSTKNKIEVLCFTQELVKTEILKLGLDHGLSLKDLWPCYNGQAEWCLNCESCLRFQRAALENNINITEELL